MIEPSPHNKPSHAHFHSSLICPKARIVEVPEPDRCMVTELPCSFQSPLGKLHNDKLSRQREYGIRILQYGAYFEYYTTRKLIDSLKTSGINIDQKKLPNMGLGHKISLIHALNIIDNSTFSKLMSVKKERDKLAHEAKPFHSLYELEDKRAMEIIRKAEECMEVLRS